MKKAKKYLLVGLCLIMVFALAACTGTPASTATEEPAAAADETATEAPEVVVEDGDVVAEGGESTDASGGEVDLSTLTVAVSLGWLENEAGMRQKQGYEETFNEVGITNYSFVDANYDPVMQSEQIEAIIQAKPDLLFITPSDPSGITEATQHAIDAGIPVFCSDGTVKGCEDQITSQVIIDNYSGGYATMEYLAEKLDGKGKIGMIILDANDSWNQRGVAAYDCMAKYPDMEAVNEWSWDSTGVNTPRMAVDNFLAAAPNVGDIDAIWCAWDGGVFEGIQACQAAGRTEIIFAGFDGGEEACNMLVNDDEFVVCNGPAIYTQAQQTVYNAIDWLEGKTVEQTSFATNVLLTKEAMQAVQLEDGEALNDFDKPGMAEKWGLPLAPTVTNPNL